MRSITGFRKGAEEATSRTSSSILVKRYSGNVSLKVPDEEFWKSRRCLMRIAVATVAISPSAIEKHRSARSTIDRLNFITAKSGARAQTQSANRLIPTCYLAESNWIGILIALTCIYVPGCPQNSRGKTSRIRDYLPQCSKRSTGA